MRSTLLTILFYLSFPGFLWAQANIIISSTMESELHAAVDSVILETLTVEDREEGVIPSVQGMKQDLVEIVYELYLGGYVRLEDYEKLKIDYDSLENIVVPDSGIERVVLEGKLKNIVKSFFVSKLAAFKASPRKCTTYLGIVNNSQCCQGLVVGPHQNYKFPSGNFKKDFENCNKHSECFSGVCSGIEDGEAAGTCEAVKTCFQEIATNQACGENNPICKDRQNGVECLKVDFNSSNTNSCKKTGVACSSNVECCSDSCNNGTCSESMKCLKCARSGVKPQNNESCCPGLYKGLEGKCIQDWPPFILPQSSLKKLNVFEKIAFVARELLGIPKVYAKDDSKKCQSPCNHVSHLPSEEKKNIEDMQRDCVRNGSEKEIKECMTSAQQIEMSYYSAHKANGTIIKSEGTKSQEEYVSEYNIPHVTARGLSDVKQCRFNSMKDDWADASNLEKNAEVTLRAFEYMYSGKGDDWWVEKGQSKNIYKRLSDAASSLRKNRFKYIKDLQRNDEKMTCLCIAAFGGVGKFPDRAQFFKDSCESDSEIQEEIAANSILDNGDSDGGSNDGQSNNLDNVTQGATGIKHEQFLVNWLDKRRNIQIDRFIANSELEKELTSTIEYLRTEPWTTGNEHGERVLYKYAIKWTAGWIAWAAVLTGIGAIFALAIALNGGGGLWWNSGVGAGLAIIGVSTALFHDTSLAPNIVDKPLQQKECWRRVLGVCVAKFNGFERQLHYKRSSHCQINGPSHLCLKNAYIAPNTNTQNKEGYYLIDIPTPLFVDASKIKYNNNFTSAVNKAFETGFNRLEKTKPNKTRNSSRWRGSYANRSSKYEHRNVFFDYYVNSAGDVRYNYNRNGYQPLLTSFSPDNYNLENFNPSFKASFIDGIKKYANCFGLKACGASAEGLGEEDIGFKLFFENPETGSVNEEEVNAFAEYVYQLHFLWPNTSEENSLSYPLPGMLPYFEAILYNIKLLGSLNADRGNRYYDAYDAYDQDLQKRMKDYAMNAGAMGLGEKSRNVKYSRKFMAAFQKIDLKGGVGIASMQSELDSAIKSNQYTEAEARALKAGIAKAMKAADDKKRAAHYENTQGKTERGKANVAGAQRFLKAFNSPIDRFPTNASGSRFAGANNNDLASTMSDSLNASKTASVNPNTNSNNAMGSYAPWDSSSSASSWGSGSSSSSGGGYESNNQDSSKRGDQLNSDLSNSDVEHMLRSLDKDKSLFEDNADDTIFIKVSKAYRRNLERMLVRKGDLANNAQTNTVSKESIHSDISDEEKKHLRELLKKNK